VHRTPPLILVAILISISAGWAAGRQSQPAPSATPTVEEALAALRADLQGKRADIIAKNVTLTEEQAARFWPVYQNYQKEQNAIMDEQLRGIQSYVDTYQTLDDSTALGLINAHLDRDVKMAALRQTWFAEFLKVLPARVAGRVMQIDRRLSLAHQVQFTSKIPLIQ